MDVLIEIIRAMIPEKRNTKFDADFTPIHKMFSTKDKGFCFGEWKTTMHSVFEHGIITAPSGGGKTTLICLPTIYNLSENFSLVINDPSGNEIYSLTSGALTASGIKILKLDFNNPQSSIGFNALAKCKTHSDIQKVAHVLIKNSMGESKDVFWERSSEMLICCMAKYLVFHAEPQFKNLANVLHLVNQFAVNPTEIDKLMVATKDQELLQEYKAINATGDKTLQGIISSTRAALNIFQDPSVAMITSHDTLDFEDLRNFRIAIYLCTSVTTATYFRAIAALFYESLFNHILSEIPSQEKYPIAVILDEAASMKFSALSLYIANLRKFRCSVMLLLQSQQQLISLYGNNEAYNIKNNTSYQVYLPRQPLESCKEIFSILGQFQFYDEESNTRKLRPLMTVQEIFQCEETFIIHSNVVTKTKLVPYYEQPKLKALSQIAPYKFVSEMKFNAPVFIRFSDET
jgi:type IV secretory pathway TraG/TraD family ATPase VirD4